MVDTLNKIIPINLNLTETNVFKNETYQTNETFWTSDVNSAYLEFTTDTVITSGTASLVLKNVDDGSVVQRVIELSANTFEYMLREKEVKHAGRWYGQIVVNSDGKYLTATSFRFLIKGGLLDSSEPALFDIENYNKLSSQLMSLYNQFNGYLDDVGLSEGKRELAESIRESLFLDSQEARRIAFEASQLDKDNLFVESETNRSETFTESESARQQNEASRKTEESKRVAAENVREENYESKLTAAIVEADVVEKVDNKVAELSPTIQQVTAQLAQTQKEFDTAVGAVTVDSEVVLARGDETTLDSRLNKIESEKANKKQEEWITPTLLNGIESNAGNPVQYMKDELGFVHFRGRFININSAVAFMLPIGYRPKTILDLATQRGILASIWVNGTVIFSGTSTYPDNSIAHFTFRVEG